MTNIVAFAGRKGSGKNTAANVLIAYEMCRQGFQARINNEGKIIVLTDGKQEGVLELTNPSPAKLRFLSENVYPFVKSYAFADYLKEICINLFGLKDEQVYGTNEQKDSLTNISWENMPGYTGPNTGLMTARSFMQYFATEICRAIAPNCWAEATLKQITTENSALALITDCRFPSEIELIHQNGGKVIWLNRSPYPNDPHVSEHVLDKYLHFDAIIDNSKDNIAEQSDKIMDKLIEWGIYIKN